MTGDHAREIEIVDEDRLHVAVREVHCRVVGTPGDALCAGRMAGQHRALGGSGVVVSGQRAWRVGRWGCKFEVQLTILSNEDLEKIARWVDEGKYRAVVGRVAKLSQLEEVKDACDVIYSAKGGVGKFVIEID